MKVPSVPAGQREVHSPRSAVRHSLWLGLLLASTGIDLVTPVAYAQVSGRQSASFQSVAQPAYTAQPGYTAQPAYTAQPSGAGNPQPSRLAASPNMQPITEASAATGAVTTNSNDPGVTLRWRTSARVTSSSNAQLGGDATAHGQSTNNDSLAARALAANTRGANQATFAASPATVQPAGYQTPSSSSQSSGTSNPLRASGAAQSVSKAGDAVGSFRPRASQPAARIQGSVQRANYQAPGGLGAPNNAAQTPPNSNSILDNVAPRGLQAPPQLNFPPSQMQGLNPGQAMGRPPAGLAPVPGDALDVPEAAPMPPVTPAQPREAFPNPSDFGQPPQRRLPEVEPATPEPTMPDLGNQLRDNEPATGKDANEPEAVKPQDDDVNPFKRGGDDSPSDLRARERSSDLDKPRTRPDATANCEAFRDRLRNSSIQKINLSAAPRFGQGLNDDREESDRQRLDFAAGAELRDWCDRHGRTLVQGRMIDLVNEQVVLDNNGVRREIALRDLCDVDLAYVGKAWNLPISCGSGYEQVAGRSFVPSAIQWKASGLCHKPLYFEEVQLERYGHEVGPILQPLISSAHFFGNIAVLPYKMGIHPPNECQYALGYYRPGDCAPYMLPPVPISLRGAAVQAGVVTGAAALIP